MRNWKDELEYGDNYDNYPYYPEDYPAEVLNDIDFLEEEDCQESEDGYEDTYFEWWEENREVF